MKDKSNNYEPKKNRLQIGIKWKMFAVLLMFVILIAAATWIFQAHMLYFFYQNTKFDELDDVSQDIIANIQNIDVLEEKVSEYAENNYMDIWVFSVKEDSLDQMIGVNGSTDAFFPFLTKRLSVFYERAVENGGSYTAMISKEHYNNNLELRVIKDNMGENTSHPFVTGNIRNVNAVKVNLFDVGGERYAVIQKSDFTPMETIVEVLQDQFAFTGTFFIILALIFATVMSKLITTPIVRMNKAAKELAHGNYETDFSGTGYREINELGETLNYAANELSHNDRLQKELISNISHDLRTPLTMIKGYSEVMRDIPGENTPENIQVIIDETERLNALVNDMLDISKIQSGARVPEFSEFSFTDAVRQTMLRYEKLTMQNGYSIEFDADADVNVMADRGMILQVVYNLINNAINYTGEDKRVYVKQTVENGIVKLSVTDTGEGIAEEDIPRIWDRYYKVDKVHRRATVGTGLGLSIVKSILETHNASFGVQSSKGHGSTFWFELNIFDSEKHMLKY